MEYIDNSKRGFVKWITAIELRSVVASTVMYDPIRLIIFSNGILCETPRIQRSTDFLDKVNEATYGNK